MKLLPAPLLSLSLLALWVMLQGSVDLARCFCSSVGCSWT